MSSLAATDENHHVWLFSGDPAAGTDRPPPRARMQRPA